MGKKRGDKKTVATVEQRRRLRETAAELATRDQTILAHIDRRIATDTRGQTYTFYRVHDVHGSMIMQVPVDEVGDDPRGFFMALAGFNCVECQTPLLDGEEGMCGTCESQHVMGLMRLRDSLR